MITNMITDDDEEDIHIDFDDYSNLSVDDYNDYKIEQNRSLHIDFSKQENIGPSPDLYQELAEKDHYLMLAAEAGKVLLEKNQELTHHYENLQEDYLKKIEELEQERHHLKRELTDREHNYESRMQDLQHEVSSLVGQLNQVQKTSRSFEQSHRSNYDDLSIQNDSLHQELNDLKLCNKELIQQVQTLSKRFEEKNENNHKMRRDSYGDLQEDFMENSRHGSPNINNGIDYREIKKLKEQVNQLNDHKQFLEESLSELLHEKEAILKTHKSSSVKVSSLEDEISSLRQEINVCQDDLKKTKKKNIQLKDQLEEYVLLQQSSQHMGGNSQNSLFNELEMSLSEADMNFHTESTPKKKKTSEVDEEDNIFNHSNLTIQKLKADIINIYTKLKQLQSQLSDSEHNNNVLEGMNDDIVNNAELVTKLVDHVIELIHDKVLSLGAIDARSESPCRLDLDNCDILSQTDSQLSDRDADILEQQVHDLNQRLNFTTTELENARKELTSAQTLAKENEEEAQALSVKSNAQEREIDSLRKEREILLSDTSMEDKLKKALEERDAALRRENEMQAKFEQSQCDMNKLNNQLIAAVQQKLELSEQLEQWQFDMASLIDKQLANKIKQENKKTRKRNSPNTTAKFFASKFFSSKSNSKETSRSSTPTVK